MKHYWNWVKGQWVPIVVCVAVGNILLLGWAYIDTNQRAQKLQDAEIAESKKQTEQIVAALNRHSELLNTNDQQLKEYGENITCILAILNPKAVPNADPVKCRARLSGINNSDGTFLSGTWPPLPPEPGSKELPGKPDTHSNPQTGFLEGAWQEIAELLNNITR